MDFEYANAQLSMPMKGVLIVAVLVIIYFIYEKLVLTQGLNSNFGMSPNYWLLRSKQPMYGGSVPLSMLNGGKQGLQSSPIPWRPQEHLISPRAFMVDGMTGNGPPSDSVLSAVNAGII